MFVTIDQEKCSKDLKCVDECPVKIFNFSKEKKEVFTIENPETICIKCGHCVAVCPEDAISLADFSQSQFIPNDKQDLLNRENIEYILRSRRSIRSYKKQEVEKEKLEKLLDLSSAAPTGHNSRSVNWTVFYDKNKLKKLKDMVIDWMKYVDKENPETSELLSLKKIIEGNEAGFDGIFREAPHLIVAHASKFAPTAAIDCATAVSYLEIAAPSFGLGTCWAGFFNIAASMWPPLKKEIGLPKGHKCFSSVMIGMPKHSYSKIIKRKTGEIFWS